MISISLNKEIGCDKICMDIQKLINRYKQQNPDSKDVLLTIDIKEITYDDNSMIPKIEHHKID